MTTRPSFGLSRWASPDDDDAWAEWQEHVDAGRVGGRLRDPALEAAVLEMERIVCGRPGPKFRSNAASGSSTSAARGEKPSETTGTARRWTASIFGVDREPNNNERECELPDPVRLLNGASAPG